MSESKKWSTVLFVFILALFIFVAATLTYREAARRHFANQNDENSSQQADDSQVQEESLAEKQSEKTPKDARLTGLPGGDVGYASDIVADVSTSEISDSSEQASSPTSNGNLASNDTDNFEAAILWGGDQNSKDDEVSAIAPQDVAETTPASPVSNETELASETDEIKKSDQASSSTKTDETSLASSIPMPDESNDATSDAVLALAEVNKTSLDDELYDSTQSISQDMQDDDSKIADLSSSDELYDQSPSTSVGVDSQHDSATDFNSLPNAFSTSADDSIVPSASSALDNSEFPQPQQSETATNSDSFPGELAVNVTSNHDDLAFDNLSTTENQSTQPDVSADSSEELLADELSSPGDSTTPKVSSDFDASSVELAANDLPKSNDLTSDPLAELTINDLSQNDAAADELADSDSTSSELSTNDFSQTNDSTEPDDLAASTFSSSEPAINDFPQTNDSTESGDLTVPDVSTSELAVNNLSQTVDSPESNVPSENLDAPSTDLAANDLPRFDDLASDSLPVDASAEFAINDSPQSDALTFPDVPADSAVSSTELTTAASDPISDKVETVINDLSKVDDLTSNILNNDWDKAESVANDTSQIDDLTAIVSPDNSDETEFSVNELDDSNTNKVEPTVENLPDGLGIVSGKSSPAVESSVTQNSNFAVNQTPEPLDKPHKSQPAIPFDSSLFELSEKESTNYYLERWNKLDKAWQEYLAPLSDEERFDALERYQSEMDKTLLAISKRLAFAIDLNSSERDRFFRFYVSRLAIAKQTAELTALLLEERASGSTNDARLGYLEFLFFKARIEVVGASQDSNDLVKLSQELLQTSSTSNVKFFLRKTKELTDQIGQYNPALGKRTYDALCQEFANSQDRFRQNMPRIFAGEARFERLSGNELEHFSGVSVDGLNVDLADYRGKTTLVVLTNSSCAPYLDELPSLRDVYAKYHSAGFEIVEYNLDADVDGLRKFLQTQNVPWTVISRTLTAQIDAKDFVNPCVYYGISNLPTSILLDKNGKVISTNARRERLEEELVEIYPDVR